jgi:hypothetical protein
MRSVVVCATFGFCGVLCGCGGGGGSGGGQAPAVTTAQFVDQIEWTASDWNNATTEIDGTHVTIDGVAAHVTDLNDGEVVRVNADQTTTHSPDGSATTATTVNTIVADSLVVGPVDSTDLPHRRLVVLGQPIQFSLLAQSNCAICDPNSGLPNVHPGDIVRVAGYVSVHGTLLARRIDRDANAATVRATGVASAVDTSAHRLTINGVAVDFSSIAEADMPISAINAGSRIRVVGTLQPAPETIVAANVVAIESLRGDGAQVELDGLIDQQSMNTIVVSGNSIAVPAQCSAIADELVRVNAVFDQDGALNAAACPQIKGTPELLHGDVEAVNTATGVLTVLGIPVQTDFATPMVDTTDSSNKAIPITDLAIGDTVSVIGAATSLSPTDGIAATNITRTDASPMSIVGQPSNATSPEIVIYGQTVNTDSATTFASKDCQGTTAMSASQYFQQATTLQQISVERRGATGLWATQIALIVGCWDY